MTTILDVWSKQPSYETYLQVKAGELNWLPFKWRALIINRYLKSLRPVAQLVEYVSDSREVDGSNPFRTARLLSRTSKKKLKRNKPSSQKNFRIYNGLRVVSRLTSGGRKRPSRNKKRQFISCPLVVHLKGNKYSGGQSLF